MELSIGGISTSGVSNQYVQQMLLQQLDTAQSAMLATESQLSSGKQMTEGSDNPVATMQIVNLDSQLDSNAQMTNNVTANQAYLSTTDAALSNVASLLSQVQSDTLSAAGSTATSQQRSAAAAEVGEAIQELMNIGNQQFDGRYLFAGSDAAVAPFTTTANGLIQYNGNNQNIDSFSNANVMFPTNVTGAAAFSALSSPIEGANLNPELTAETPLADLREGAGVALGNIEISDGSSQPTVIDLSQAQTVGDVATMIEDNPPAGRSVQVAIGPTGLNVSLVPVAGESKTLSISDIGNGLTAKQLGIAGLSNNGAIYGGALNPTISLTTPLSALNGGAGIDQTSGLQIVGNGTTQTVSLAGCQTIQDVINALNSSGTGLVAQINSSKTGLEVYSNLSGCDFSIGENGGQTATDLGLRTFTANTPLSDLNHGAGVAAAQGDSQSFTVTAADGTAYDVSIAGLSTVGQVMSAIKTDSGGKVSAELSQYGNGIQLVDDTTSPGSVSATADPTSTAAVDLGLIPSGKSTVAGSTKGFASAAVNFGGQANSGLLIQSNMAGTAGDVQIIFQNGATLSPPVYDATNNTLTFNVVNGVTTASQLVQEAAADPTVANAFSVTLDTAADPTNDGSGTVSTQLLSAPPLYAQGGTPSVLGGSDANPQEAAGVFNALLRLTTALNANDQAEIQRNATQLQQASQNLSLTQASLGAEEQTLSSVQTQLTSQNTQLQSLLSNNQDVDMATVISELTAQQVAYQASLQTMAQMFKMTLLNYLS